MSSGKVEFEGFPKIPRLSRDCIITEKIDGTNAQIYIYEVPGTDVSPNQLVVQAGSRNRWITPEQDNHNFAKWVRDHQDQLIKELGVGRHYGEWWGKGINGRYKDAPKTFSLFNAGRWTVPKKEGLLTVCDVVPILHEGMFGTNLIQVVLDKLAAHGSQVWPGAEAEGIIIYHTAACMMFKKTLKGDEKPKGQVTE